MEEMEKRIINLEIKFTHQDDLINHLNKIVAGQQFTIDSLLKEIKELKLETTNSSSHFQNEKPPHY